MRQVLQRDADGKRMARFAIVGIGNTAVTLISYVVLLALGASYIVAGPIAWTLGVLNGYTWNRIWTFDRAPHRTSLMGKYFAVGFLGLCLNTALLAVLVDPIGAAKLFAELIALAVTVLSTYLANRHWVFGSHLSAVTGRAHSRGDA